ncbi:MAG: hypothetical protein HY023_05940 [Chloroflexi bacterium]|nr:hypothetical protein [Chloroflexota bacterium]MBI3760502.1 hypothetical protein [Chloroflexota bacterium]
MAKIAWESVQKHWCDLMQEEAHLLEERIYPDDLLPDAALPYQVGARKCSFGIDCNLAGYHCRWAWTNPDYDPFTERPTPVLPL